MEALQRALKETAALRIHSPGHRHLRHERNKTPREIKMTKFVCFAAALALFAPVAAVTLLQAAQIVA